MVGQHVGGRTALSEEHERAEDLVLDDTGHQLQDVRGLRLHHHAREPVAEAGDEATVGSAYLGLALEVEQDGPPPRGSCAPAPASGP
ncbi:hypothetical protein GCM10020000_04210 [Streptomyces olivoverticillatus]